MLTVPNLPTDNLYKFVALSGLTLVILSVAVWVARGNALSDKLDQLWVEQAAIGEEIKSLEADVDRGGRKPSPSLKEAEAVHQRTQELAVRVATSTARATIALRLAREQTALTWWTTAGMIAGAVFA